MREPALLDMKAWLHDRTEASTDLYLLPKLPRQNQHHSKQGYKFNSNTGLHTTGINSNHNLNQKTHISKMIVLQSTIQNFTNISRQIKGIEIRKQERKILCKTHTSKGKKTELSHLQA